MTRIEWLVVTVAVVAVMLGVTSHGVSSVTEFDTILVKAQSGDTLWGLAAAHPVEGLTTGETATVIAEMNGLSEGTISAGSTVVVPATEDGRLALAMR